MGPLQRSIGTPTSGTSMAQLVLVRTYTKRKKFSNTIPWQLIRTKELENAEKERKSKAKSHKETLERFRLTRFGWERRRARFNARRRRNFSYQTKQRVKKIEFVHRADLRKLKRTAPFL